VQLVCCVDGRRAQHRFARQPGSSPSLPRYSAGRIWTAFVRVTPTLNANHWSSASTGQSLPNAIRAPASAR
jgi:hypothetical protein